MYILKVHIIVQLRNLVIRRYAIDSTSISSDICSSYVHKLHTNLTTYSFYMYTETYEDLIHAKIVSSGRRTNRYNRYVSTCMWLPTLIVHVLVQRLTNVHM